MRDTISGLLLFGQPSIDIGARMAVTAYPEAGASGQTISNKHGFPSSALKAAVSEPMT